MAKTLPWKTHKHTQTQMKLKIVRGEAISGLECSTLRKGFCPNDGWDLLGIYLRPSKRCIQVPLCGNMTFLGNRIFADVLTFSWGHTELECALIQFPVSLKEEGNLDTYSERHRQENGMWGWKMEAEIRVLLPQAKDIQKPPEVSRGTENTFSFGALKKTPTLVTSWFQTSCLHETISFSCSEPPSMQP